MKQKSNYIQKQYEGFLNTENLWVEDAIANLQQFEFPRQAHKISLDFAEPRLGKRVEQFVLFQLEKEQIPVLASNLQIQKNKETIGEIDFIVEQNGQPIHLEVCYKYYLYDPNIIGDEIAKWIGPNRRDSFSQKLHKLETKQFPLLQNPVTQQKLSDLGIPVENISQKVLFKAQLFLPCEFDFKNSLQIDESSIEGFYYRLEALEIFSDCKFFIPVKPDWLIEPQTQIDWLNYTRFKIKVTEFLNKKNAPLVWLKKPSGELIKIFVVWW